MHSLKGLHDRLRSDPVTHLGRKSVHLIMAYELGYELGQTRHGVPLLAPDISWPKMQEWVERKFQWTAEMGCRQNVAGFAQLMAADEAGAFDFYFEMRDTASRELPSAVDNTGTETMPFAKSELVDFIASESFRERASVILGRRRLDALWALCSGFTWAERDNGITTSPAQNFTTQFQQWIEDRYPFAKGRPWNKTLDFLVLDSSERAWTAFYDALDSFLAGQRPDTLTKTGEQMLQAITKKILESDPNADANEIESTFKQTVKNICPS